LVVTAPRWLPKREEGDCAAAVRCACSAERDALAACE